ncbi:MAG: AMP-binding protein, partial [Eubacteriales bacterium]|nr:AMP-binding protein [Eubacteriales bacterium]
MNYNFYVLIEKYVWEMAQWKICKVRLPVYIDPDIVGSSISNNKPIKYKLMKKGGMTMLNNILDYLEESKRNYPDKVAFADENTSLTYKELWEVSDKIGAALTKYIMPRQAVLVYMDKSCSAIALFMGIVKAGGFYVLLDPAQPAERLNIIIATLGAEACIVNEKTDEKAKRLDFSGSILLAADLMKHVISEDERKQLTKVRKEALDIDPLYSIFTSGSTGTPKGVIVNHRSVIDFIECFTQAFGITSEDV